MGRLSDAGPLVDLMLGHKACGTGVKTASPVHLICWLRGLAKQIEQQRSR
jgi:hypothetical protein